MATKIISSAKMKQAQRILDATLEQLKKVIESNNLSISLHNNASQDEVDNILLFAFNHTFFSHDNHYWGIDSSVIEHLRTLTTSPENDLYCIDSLGTISKYTKLDSVNGLVKLLVASMYTILFEDIIHKILEESEGIHKPNPIPSIC